MELKCPNCNTTFEVNENYYAALLAQVKNAEFDAELERRIHELSQLHKAEESMRFANEKSSYEKKLADKASETAELKQEIERLKGIVDNNDALQKAAIAQANTDKTNELAQAAASFNAQIAELKSEIALKEKELELELSKARNSNIEELHEKENQITLLKAGIEEQKSASENKILELKNLHASILKAKDDEIAHYKDMKVRLSTKMLGETLEQYCFNIFSQHQSLGLFPDATFNKDNDTHPGGTKGDFIFRDFIDDKEYISIMFEMKNEADTTAAKQKNSHFFEKLHKDRCEKNCQYAILVSMLEQDNETYNAGIVNIPQYENMFVIRPQMFINTIAILCQNAKRSISEIHRLQSQLEIAQAQSVDITNFETKRNKFGEEFAKWVDNANKKHNKAIADIDKAIEGLEKHINTLRNIRHSFEESDRYFNKANDKFETDFTIKKLTRGNPTMRAKFEEERLRLSNNLEHTDE